MARINPYKDGCPPEVLRQQAEDYAKLFALFRKYAAGIARISFWNLQDGESWLNGFPWQRVNHPLLFDRERKPKQAYDAVIRALGGPAGGARKGSRSFDPDRAARLAAEAGLERMRERADEVVPGASLGQWKDTAAFLRAGATGEWRSRTDEASLRRYRERVASLVSPDLATWAHRGRIASGVDARVDGCGGPAPGARE